MCFDFLLEQHFLVKDFPIIYERFVRNIFERAQNVHLSFQYLYLLQNRFALNCQ